MQISQSADGKTTFVGFSYDEAKQIYAGNRELFQAADFNGVGKTLQIALATTNSGNYATIGSVEKFIVSGLLVQNQKLYNATGSRITELTSYLSKL